MKFRCIKEFELSVYDEEENPTEDYKTVHVGSIYEYESGYCGESDVRMYLEDGDDDFGYIDITYSLLDECFERIA